jgi:hypothetical protein
MEELKSNTKNEADLNVISRYIFFLKAYLGRSERKKILSFKPYEGNNPTSKVKVDIVLSPFQQ